MDQTPEQTGGATLSTASEAATSSGTPASQPVAAAEDHNPTLMGVLAYIGPLVIIPFLMAKDNDFVKFHIKQGLVLLVIGIALWLLEQVMYLGPLYMIVSLLNLGLFILSIVGIVNVLQKKEEKLPLVGEYASHFKI